MPNSNVIYNKLIYKTVPMEQSSSFNKPDVRLLAMTSRRLILHLSDAEFLQLAELAQRCYTSPLVLAHRAVTDFLVEGIIRPVTPDLADLPSRDAASSEERGKGHLPRYLRRFVENMPNPLAVIAYSETPVADASACARALTHMIDPAEPQLAAARSLLAALLLFVALETPDFAEQQGLATIWEILNQPEHELRALLHSMASDSTYAGGFAAIEAARFARLPSIELAKVIELLRAHPSGFFDGRA